MAKGGDEQPGTPSAPGWYPDPWSATGEGERYFDGRRWGTTERPLGRHTVATVEPGDRPTPGRSRRMLVPILVLVALVGVYLGVSNLLGGGADGDGGDAGDATSQLTQVGDDGPPPADDVAAEPLGTPAPPPEGGDGEFEFLDHQEGKPNTPVAFDPCREIHYVMNPAGAPPGADARIRRAIDRVSTATGLQFVDDGETDETFVKRRDAYQPNRYDPDRWAPVLFAWGDEGSNPELAGQFAGVTSPQAVSRGNGPAVYVTGQVVLDREQLADDDPQTQATLLHELGHLVGLDHTSDRRQIMYAESDPAVTDYGDGDLRGLFELGTQPCVPGL
jgi:hypothetical protein